jgi:hypothetical protein
MRPFTVATRRSIDCVGRLIMRFPVSSLSLLRVGIA